MPQLNRSTHPAPVLPERVLQFGTGVLLRGLPDFFIDRANRQGLFRGSVVVVKSTGGSTDEFSEQDGLYTLVTRGSRKGQDVDEKEVVSAISRVLSAQEQWKDVLKAAQNPHLQIVISNTTEVGIQYVEENIFQNPPQSFPAKLTAFLYERFRNFGGSKHKGMVVIPTELVVDNGLKLREIVERLAKYNELGKLFNKWLKYHVRFCNSLVDRIVPGKPDADIHGQLEQELGYEDKLLIVAEPYRLWAIEGDERVREMLSFAGADEGVIIDEDISFYRERKLRLLNGTHTLTVPLAYLLGLQTVYESSTHPLMRPFIERIMLDEIAPTVPSDALGDEGPAAVRAFANQVLDRFQNPHIEHFLLNITLQQTSKMQARNLPTLQRYVAKFGQAPSHMTLGFAAFLRFMRAVRVEEGQYLGEIDTSSGTITYPIRDDYADYFYRRWQQTETGDAGAVREMVRQICGDTTLWGTDLNQLTGFAEAVADRLTDLLTQGPEAVLERQLAMV